NGAATPVFGVDQDPGLQLQVLAGTPLQNVDEIAFAPSTMDSLGVHIGDRVTVSAAGRSMTVVGRVLVPTTSHTAYDQSAWVTRESLLSLPETAVADGQEDFFEDYLLLTWRPDADIEAARERLQSIVDSGEGLYETKPAELPPGVDTL